MCEQSARGRGGKIVPDAPPFIVHLLVRVVIKSRVGELTMSSAIASTHAENVRSLGFNVP